jgi:hypothetical protein
VSNLLLEHHWASPLRKTLELVWNTDTLKKNIDSSLPKVHQVLDNFLSMHINTRVNVQLVQLFVNQVTEAFEVFNQPEEKAQELELSTIPRVRYDDLSMTSFLKDYAEKRIPVIVTHMPSPFDPGREWTLPYLDEFCGNVSVVDSVLQRGRIGAGCPAQRRTTTP